MRYNLYIIRKRGEKGLSDDTAILVAMITSGAAATAALLTATMSFIQRKGDRKNNLSDEYRKKKNEALEDLVTALESCHSSVVSYTESGIVPFPRYECPAKGVTGALIMYSNKVLASEDKLSEYRNRLFLIIDKHSFWFSDRLKEEFHFYKSYLDNLLYLCETRKVKPNKLLSVLLDFDFYKMHFWISKEIKKCYFEKFSPNCRSIFNKKNIRRFQRRQKELALGMLVLSLASDEKKKEYRYLKYKESDFMKRYTLCMKCELKCPLAQQDFINLMHVPGAPSNL